MNRNKPIKIKVLDTKNNTVKEYPSTYAFKKEANSHCLDITQTRKLNNGGIVRKENERFYIMKAEEFSRRKIKEFKKRRLEELILGQINKLPKGGYPESEIYVLNKDLSIKTVYTGLLKDFCIKYKISYKAAKTYLSRFKEKTRFNNDLIYCYSKDYVNPKL